jgi:hypothetical protein
MDPIARALLRVGSTTTKSVSIAMTTTFILREVGMAIRTKVTDSWARQVFIPVLLFGNANHHLAALARMGGLVVA